MGIEVRHKTRLMVVAAWLAILVMLGVPSNLHASDSNDTIPTAPVIAEGDSISVPMSEDGVPTEFSLVLNATDADGGVLSWSVSSPATTGAASASSTGGTGTQASVSYLQVADFFGSDSFDVRVTDTSNLSDTITVNVTIDAINDMPSFTAGPNQTVLEDSGANTVANWATAISKGPANESGQAVDFIVTNDNNDLFSAPPAVSPDGQLTFTPAPEAFGLATVTVKIHDDGGTDDSGIDTSEPQQFTITVSAVNDAPSFTVGSNQSVGENSGIKTVNNWATDISAGPDNESDQDVDFIVTNDNPGLFSVQPTVSPDGQLTFTPAPDTLGSATVTVVIYDDGGTADGGVDTSESQQFTITVATLNVAPSFTAGSSQSVVEDSGAKTVAEWATDISAGPLSESGQDVDFIVTNNNTGLFSAQPAVSPAGQLTFTPAPNVFGSATVTVKIHDDGGTANGGVDTSDAQQFTIAVSAVNDAPSFTVGSNQWVIEDSGTTTVANWATDISAGPANESGQDVDFIVTNDNNGLFSTQPEVSPAGRLTFAPQTLGSATVTVKIHDDGGTDDGGVDTSEAQQFTITVRQAGGVTATKVVALSIDADNSILPSPGDTVRYTVTVTHVGDAPAAGVVLSDTLDSNTELVNGSVDTSKGNILEGNQSGDSSVQVNIGTISAGATVVITYDALINNPLPEGVAEIVNQAFVQGRDFPEIPSDDPTLPGNTDKTVLSLVAKPDLSATKVFAFETGSGQDGIGGPGDTLVYTVTVVNSGNQGATNVVITDVVDSNTTLLTGTVATTQGAITSGNDAGDTSVQVDAGTIGGGGGDVSVTFKVRINDTISAGAKGIQNQAVISSAGQPDLKSDDPNFDGDQDPTFTSISADVRIVASMTAFFRTDTNMNNVADSGDELLYYIQIVNTGSRAATDTVYENLLGPQISTPDGAVNADTGEVTAGNIFGSESVVVSLGDLPGGGEVRISYRVVIDNTVGLPDLFDSGEGDSKVLTNQGVVRYTNQETGELVEVLTDDPNQPGAEDKTPMIVHGADTIFLPMLSR